MMSLCYCCSQGGLGLILRLIRLHQKAKEVYPAIIRKYLRMRDISLLVRACNCVTNMIQLKCNTNTVQYKYNAIQIQIEIEIHANTDLQVAALGHHTAVVVGQGGHRGESVTFSRRKSFNISLKEKTVSLSTLETL